MLITTIHGEIDDSLLEKREGVDDNPTDIAKWVEYWKDGELVHRSAHVVIKQGTIAGAMAGAF